jgi:DNA-binding winged helix-turn-helix (wHTH) protein
MALQVAILGSVEPRMNGEVVGVPAGKQRALLALLAVQTPHPVSAESAAEALWPRAAPAEAMRSLQVTVSRLRRSLGSAGSALETVPSGYRLAVEADAIDARRFETLINAAQAARLGGDAAAARRLLDEALGLWRGPALADAGLLGAASAIGSIAHPDLMAKLEQQFFDTARAQLGDRRWSDAMQAGRRRAFHDAIELALGAPGPSTVPPTTQVPVRSRHAPDLPPWAE